MVIVSALGGFAAPTRRVRQDRHGRSRVQVRVRDKAAEYRREAAACLEVANGMPRRDDRVCMTEMAQRWLELAQKAESSVWGTSAMQVRSWFAERAFRFRRLEEV
jgi:hypothetical protein